jgi:hypothetical protein
MPGVPLGTAAAWRMSTTFMDIPPDPNLFGGSRYAYWTLVQ